MLNVHTWLESVISENNRIQSLAPSETLTQSFMEVNTDYSNIWDFMRAFQNMHAMTGTDIDTYVRSNTYFDSWIDMRQTAYEETFLKQG